ncbi:hypothetical protein G7Y89_g12969 [Cudoniella acicularis]|uniref:Uncharacterized protein n=1 Tax=Cudoniella acicularis TaxID=354080 RepID=A0A8H4VYP2_9HELO|nr:hypothetical protein G7Y89_g12969 [Cudoniella acicularis]
MSGMNANIGNFTGGRRQPGGPRRSMGGAGFFPPGGKIHNPIFNTPFPPKTHFLVVIISVEVINSPLPTNNLFQNTNLNQLLKTPTNINTTRTQNETALHQTTSPTTPIRPDTLTTPTLDEQSIYATSQYESIRARRPRRSRWYDDPYAQGPGGPSGMMDPYVQGPGGLGGMMNPYAQGLGGPPGMMNPYAQGPGSPPGMMNPYAQGLLKRRR